MKLRAAKSFQLPFEMRIALRWLLVFFLASGFGCGESESGRDKEPGTETGIEVSAWPRDRTGLVFLWESSTARNEIGRGASRRVCRVEPRGGARIFRDREMDPGGGSFAADESSSAVLETVLDAGGSFSVEALVTAEREQDGAVMRFDTLALVQRGDALVFTAAEPSPVSARVGSISPGTPLHFVAVFQEGVWRFHLDGAAWEGEAVSPADGGGEGAGLSFGGSWEGKLMGIALFSRALTAEEAGAHHAFWSDVIASRQGDESAVGP